MNAQSSPLRGLEQAWAEAERPPTGRGAQPPAGNAGRTRLGSPASVSATRQRKLHVGHFAFMRSVVQGLDSRDSWERYFRVEGEATDQRTVRATIAWIRQEFAAAAKRQDRFGTARLVRIKARGKATVEIPASLASPALRVERMPSANSPPSSLS